MKDPIKERINPKTNKKTFEFAINLGVPPGDDKPLTTRRRGFITRKEAMTAYHLLKAQAANGIYPARKSALKEDSTVETVETVAQYFPTY